MFVPKWTAAAFFAIGSAMLSDNPSATTQPGVYGIYEQPFIRAGLHGAITRMPVLDFPLPIFFDVGLWGFIGLPVRPYFVLGAAL